MNGLVLTDVRERAAKLFPGRCNGSDPRVAEVEKGGSDRRFYRVTFPHGDPVIAVHYGSERAENALYAPLARFLHDDLSLPVPEVLDESANWIWMEDLGADDLWAHREADWPEKGALYGAAIDAVARLHRVPLESFENAGITLSAGFDEALYLWEQDYFFEHGLGTLLGLSIEDRCVLREKLPLTDLASELGRLPRVPIHRDFQSQNLMIANGQPMMIDFQGMRAGLGAYDVASLLYDPYTALTENERDELAERYVEYGGHVPKGADFFVLLRKCAMQRLMQAMGAYGFLGRVKGKTAFLAYAHPSAERLASMAAGVPGFEPLIDTLKHLPTHLPTHLPEQAA